MCRRDVQAQLLHQPRQAGRLALGQLQHEPGESRGVDDRVRQWTFQSPADQPRVEGVVAVLHQDGPVREAKKGSARVAKFRRPDQHRPIDVMSLLGVGIDGRSAIDEGVEE
jgi:hypothetical protein